ncbi:MarR family winged helix-turn-helix transcriptional regulator [Rhizobium sp. PAMB 3182]
MGRYRQNGLSEDAAGAAVMIDDTLSVIRRSMIRRQVARKAIEHLSLDIDVPQLEVVHTVGSAACMPDSGEVTVGTIAERLAIDPSRASRLVAEVVERGLLRRVASQGDARRICLELTETGQAYLDAIFDYKAIMFSQAVRDWDDEDLVTFARLFKKYSSWIEKEGTDLGEATARVEALVDSLKRRGVET